MANYLVIGMGRFGRSIAKTLYENNQTVLAIDSNPNLIQEAINENIVYDALVMDAKDELALRKVAEGSFDTAFVCMGTNIQDSILITLILKDMGIHNIICKATSKVHGKVLEKVGASRVIFPEEEMGAKVAFSILNPSVVEYFKFEDDIIIVEVLTPERYIGKKIKDIDIRATYNITIIAIKCKHEKSIVSPSPNIEIPKDSRLIVLGRSQNIKELTRV